jgi:TIGR03009 family protein
MRSLGLTFAALLVAASTILAQAPGTPTVKDASPPGPKPMSEKNQKYLDAYLKVWEERMASINGLETKVIYSETEDGQKTVFTGDAALMKPNFARLMLKEAANPTNAKKWRHHVADGQYLWEFNYSSKVARVLQLPKEGVGDNTMITILSGMKAADVKKRFDVTVDVDDSTKFNENYIHFTIYPKTKEDQQEFKKAELVLWKNDKDPKYVDFLLLPARLWFQSPNGNQVTWEFKNMTIKKSFPKDEFKAPGFPDKEWRSEWVRPPVTVSRTSAPPK